MDEGHAYLACMRVAVRAHAAAPAAQAKVVNGEAPAKAAMMEIKAQVDAILAAERGR